MGVAAYNRGSAVISNDIARQDRAAHFQMMDALNAIPRKQGAHAPFGPIHLISSHGGWFAECPTTGYGFWYRTLRDAVSHWLIDVTEWRDGVWVAVPR